MTKTCCEEIPLRGDEDIVLARRLVRQSMVELGFSLVDQTKLVTAASELCRNAVSHGGGGTMRCEELRENGRVGLRLTIADHGKGIADIDEALRDGFTTRGGLGLGLGGARRLVNEFSIESAPGRGTTVTVTRWR